MKQTNVNKAVNLALVVILAAACCVFGPVVLAEVDDDGIEINECGVIGMHFREKSGSFIVDRVYPGTPASRLLRIGDLITSVNSVAVKGKTQEEVRSLLIGRPGSPVQFDVMRGTSLVKVNCKRVDFRKLDPLTKRDYLMSM